MSTLKDSLLGIQLDEYRIVTPLGFGGMARVYRALDTKLQRYVALKVIASDFRGDDEYRMRFAREAQSIARLEHPNIVHIYRLGEANGLYYMAMKYVEGIDLRRLIDNYRRDNELIPLEDTLRFVEEIGSALDYAHTQSVIHRDVKPSNIIIDQGGHAILTDFGLVFLRDTDNRDPVLGSPQYMAPEQAAFSENVVPQSDLYSLGVTVFEMLTGELPFNGADPMELARRHFSEPPPPPSSFNPAIPPAIDEIVLRCLEKEPHKRYSTGAELSAALRQGVELWTADSLRVTQPAQRLLSWTNVTQTISHLMKSSPLPAPSQPPANDVPQPPELPDFPLQEASEPAPPGSDEQPTMKAPMNQPPFLGGSQGAPMTPDRPPQASISGTAWPQKERNIGLYLVGLGVMVLLCVCLSALAITVIGSRGFQAAAIPAATRAPTTAVPSLTPLFIPPPGTSPSLPPNPPPTTVAPTATPVVLLSVPPEKRDTVPPESHRLGEFAVEWYCNDQGLGVELINNQTDWACTNANGSIRFVLAPVDFDNICRLSYKNPAAFAIHDQQKPIQAYNWSCYEYVDASTATAVSMATPSAMSLQPRGGEEWFALVNISSLPLSMEQVEFRRNAVTLRAVTAWGRSRLLPGECLRLYRSEAAPNILPAGCIHAIDYSVGRDERASWFEGRVTIFINASTFYCYPTDKC